MSDSIDFMSWPCVPEALRGKPLYHAGLDNAEEAALVMGGWKPIDVRLLPSGSDEDRAQAVKAWLEGVRLGSIVPARGVTKFVELEARIYGLLEAKKRLSDTAPMDGEDVDKLLEFGRK